MFEKISCNAKTRQTSVYAGNSLFKEYEKQFNKIKNKPKRKTKTNSSKKERKSKFLSKYGKRIEDMRNTEEVKLKNREILQNENKDKEEEFIEKFIEKVEQNKRK